MSTQHLWKDHKKRGTYAQKQGEEWFKKLSPKFKHFPEHALIAINVETGEFVTGEDERKLRAEFKEKFGTEVAGWICEAHRRQK